MTVREILKMGHPILKARADQVPVPFPADLSDLIEDMLETMEAAGGIGLAAPQIGQSRRVAIFYAPPESGNEKAGENDNWEGDELEDVDDEACANGDGDSPVRRAIRRQTLTILINPEIEVLDPEIESGYEACLSVPGLHGVVPRPRAIRFRGLNPAGEVIEREAVGFFARVVQHECDHLDGILYPMRRADLSTLAFVPETGAAEQDAESFQEGAVAG